jgi:hypothetical protein
MMHLIKGLGSIVRSRRATGLSIACLPLLVFVWFQFTGEDTEADPAAARIAQAVFEGRSGSSVVFGHYEADAGQSEDFIRTSATELTATVANAADASGESEGPNARFPTLITGEWEDDYQGKRHLTVAPDGTGTMVVDLDGIGKRLFAPRLSFDMEWSIADGNIAMKTLGGEPKSKVQVVLKLYGSEAKYKILELTADRMLLLDGDGKTQYDWRRPNAVH